MSPIESELSGIRHVSFSLITLAGDRKPTVFFEYETLGITPTIYPYVKISLLGNVVESIPDSKRLEEIAATRDHKSAEQGESPKP